MGLCFSGSLPLYFLLFTIIVSLFYLANKFSLSLSLSLSLSTEELRKERERIKEDDNERSSKHIRSLTCLLHVATFNSFFPPWLKCKK